MRWLLSVGVVVGAIVLVLRRAQVAHAFYLGTKYSKTLGACFTDSEGSQRVADMGCYGMGVSRLLAAVVEASHDDAGILWPRAIAPYAVNVVALNSGKGGGTKHASLVDQF